MSEKLFISPSINFQPQLNVIFIISTVQFDPKKKRAKNMIGKNYYSIDEVIIKKINSVKIYATVIDNIER